MHSSIELAIAEHWPELMQSGRIYCGCDEIFGQVGKPNTSKREWNKHFAAIVVGIIETELTARMAAPATRKAERPEQP